MFTNEGSLDRIVRIAVGLAVVARLFVGPFTPWAFLGLVPLVTGIVGFCPLYRVFGFSTCDLTLPRGKAKRA